MISTKMIMVIGDGLFEEEITILVYQILCILIMCQRINGHCMRILVRTYHRRDSNSAGLNMKDTFIYLEVMTLFCFLCRQIFIDSILKPLHGNLWSLLVVHQ